MSEESLFTFDIVRSEFPPVTLETGKFQIEMRVIVLFLFLSDEKNANTLLILDQIEIREMFIKSCMYLICTSDFRAHSPEVNSYGQVLPVI